MAGQGPAPKDPAKRRRTNSDPLGITKISPDDELRGEPLPDGVLPDADEWHPRTQAWWLTWRKSPQAQAFTPTDWDFLLDTALMHHTMWSKARWEFASELRLRAAKFGATPEDRMRLRMQVTTVAEQSTPAQEQPTGGRYAHLRAVRETG